MPPHTQPGRTPHGGCRNPDAQQELLPSALSCMQRRSCVCMHQLASHARLPSAGMTGLLLLEGAPAAVSSLRRRRSLRDSLRPLCGPARAVRMEPDQAATDCATAPLLEPKDTALAPWRSALPRSRLPSVWKASFASSMGLPAGGQATTLAVSHTLCEGQASNATAAQLALPVGSTLRQG